MPVNFGLGLFPSPFVPWHTAQALALTLPAWTSPAACVTPTIPSNAKNPRDKSVGFIFNLLCQFQRSTCSPRFECTRRLASQRSHAIRAVTESLRLDGDMSRRGL